MMILLYYNNTAAKGIHPLCEAKPLRTNVEWNTFDSSERLTLSPQGNLRQNRTGNSYVRLQPQPYRATPSAGVGYHTVGPTAIQ